MRRAGFISLILTVLVAASADVGRTDVPAQPANGGDSPIHRQLAEHVGVLGQLFAGAWGVPLAWINRLSEPWFDVTPVSTRAETGAGGRRLAVSQKVPQLPENMVYVRLSPRFLQRATRQDVSFRLPVTDNILGTPVAGDSDVSAHSIYVPASNDPADLGHLRLWGQAAYNTIGSSRLVQAHTTGVAQFQADIAVRFDGHGISLSPAQATATSQSTITGIESSRPGLIGRIATRIASRRAARNHDLAESVTAEHVRQQVARRFDAAADQQLAGFWDAINSGLAALPVGNSIRPRSWFARSTKEGLEIVALGPPGDGSGYVPAPTTTLGSADVMIDVHVTVIRTAMNNPDSRRLIQTAAAFQALRLSDQTELPSFHWSDDSQWLSITWKAGDREQPTRIVARPNRLQ
jgi:hypothetical protein